SATLTYTIIQGDVRKDLRYILKQYHNSRIGIPSRSNSIRDSEQQIIAHLKNKLAFTLQNYNITNSIDFKVDRCKQQIKVLAKNDDCTGEVTINYSINYIGDNLIRQASEILGISQDDVLHLSKVKRAYKKKSLELHPDKNKRNEKKFKQLNYVYKTIDEALNA
ncbi:J domain-containing protein, partial [Candidatus Cardinium sp. cBcalN1]